MSAFASAEVPTPAVDTEAVLAEGAEARDARVRASYGAVAGAYADALTDELDALPFERWILEQVADLADDHFAPAPTGCPACLSASAASGGM